MSHHGKDAKKLDGLVKLNTWQVDLFAKFVDRLAKTEDGDGSLLDHSVIFWAAVMSEAICTIARRARALVGKGRGLYKGNRHQVAHRETPIGNFSRGRGARSWRAMSTSSASARSYRGRLGRRRGGRGGGSRSRTYVAAGREQRPNAVTRAKRRSHPSCRRSESNDS
jgi:hypothetical protein